MWRLWRNVTYPGNVWWRNNGGGNILMACLAINNVAMKASLTAITTC
jgi:hypothetical protein